MCACALYLIFSLTRADTGSLFVILVVDYIKICLCVIVHILWLSERWEPAFTTISRLDGVDKLWNRKTGDGLVWNLQLVMNLWKLRIYNFFTFFESSNSKFF